MEIITYVREGAISHQDSLGNQGRTEAGDVQVMSAGSGITHSEYNREDVATRIFQIWIMPDERGGQPSWGTRPFPKGERSGTFVTLASGLGDADALPIRANGRLAAATLNTEQAADYAFDAGRKGYLVAAKGRIRVNGMEAAAGDGVAIRDEALIRVEALEEDTEVVLVDVA